MTAVGTRAGGIVLTPGRLRIGERTGISVARLRSMTFAGFQPAYRDDEASARFAGRRYDSRAAEQRTYRFAACGRCLAEDARPYLRTPWLLGWVAICPYHGTILIERCKACGASLRVAPFTTSASFSPTTCTRCASDLLDGRDRPAHPAALRMQMALLRGKQTGVTELEGLGRFTWKEIVALIGLLVGMLWTDLTLAEQEEVFLAYTSDPLIKPKVEDIPAGQLPIRSGDTEHRGTSPAACPEPLRPVVLVSRAERRRQRTAKAPVSSSRHQSHIKVPSLIIKEH